MDGRLLAENASITLNDTTINVPPGELEYIRTHGGSAPDAGGTLLLLGSGLAALFAFGRRFSVLPGKHA